jgi:hypothetical protein
MTAEELSAGFTLLTMISFFAAVGLTALALIAKKGAK